ncbi:MAG: GMC oxidoreductase [Planctomycetota bacterium]
MEFDHDFIIIGSGFGGSVSALRLAEKGYTVAVLEQGKRWQSSDFPKSNWNLRKFIWMPRLLLHGFQQITLLRDVLVFHGAGVGGGSLVYANTLLVPPEPFFKDPKWADLADWRKVLEPHYATAKRMLGVVEASFLATTDEHLLAVAKDMGREHTFHRAKVGVYFGEPGKTVPDPFFGGEGPDRTGCTLCAGCMVGCRHGAKNTLDKNYLYLAEKRGVRIVPETRVTDIRPIPGGGYELFCERSTGFSYKSWTLRARNVVVSAGVLGTVKLLMGCRDRGSLPALPRALGGWVRTNSEALIGIKAKERSADYSKGIAISAGFHADDKTHIETCRYPAGSDFMSLLGTVLVGGGKLPRPLYFLGAVLKKPFQALRLLWPFGWARRTVILLCMQPLDNSLELRMRRRWWWPFSRALDSDRGDRPPAPTHIPIANATAERMAVKMNGMPQSVLPEVLLDTCSTAHILGGCAIGHGPQDGVVDKACRVFGHEGLWVIDGSVIPANLGVNPSLTITALAEHAMSQVPIKGTAAVAPSAVVQ